MSNRELAEIVKQCAVNIVKIPDADPRSLLSQEATYKAVHSHVQQAVQEALETQEQTPPTPGIEEISPNGEIEAIAEKYSKTIADKCSYRDNIPDDEMVGEISDAITEALGAKDKKVTRLYNWLKAQALLRTAGKEYERCMAAMHDLNLIPAPAKEGDNEAPNS